MYTVMGATGRVGSRVAQILLASGHEVRVVVRDGSRAAASGDAGAEVVQADLADRDALTEALRGSRGAFAMLPFDLGAADPDRHARRLGDAIADAVAASGVEAVTMLSSIGAELVEGTGPIVGLHHLEERLRASGAVLSAIRASFFQEGVGDVLEVARADRIYPVFGLADAPVAMNATRDIARVAADTLMTPPPKHDTIVLDGPVYTEREVAGLLGEGLGTDLTVVELPRDAWHDTLIEAGFPPQAARSLEGLYDAAARGVLVPRGDRTVTVTTPMSTTIESLVGVAVGA